MGKRERKIEVLKKYISNAAGNWPAYAYGNIPKTKAINACTSYAGAVEMEDILGLIDITLSGNGKKGMIFSERKIYYDNGLLGSKGSVSYKSITDKGVIPSELLENLYNKNAMLELVSKLANIEGENFQNTLEGLNQELKDVAELYKTGKDLVNTIKEMFVTDENKENEESE